MPPRKAGVTVSLLPGALAGETILLQPVNNPVRQWLSAPSSVRCARNQHLGGVFQSRIGDSGPGQHAGHLAGTFIMA